MNRKVIEEIDAWIKQIRREFAEFSRLPIIIKENTDNIQHNYELIYELKDQIEELKQEINALKLIQAVCIRLGSNSTQNKQQSLRKINKNVCKCPYCIEKPQFQQQIINKSSQNDLLPK